MTKQDSMPSNDDLWVIDTNYVIFVLSIVILTIINSALLLVLQFEMPNPSANIQSASDALWWGIVTVSTVGYGDQFPITPADRATGILLIAVGVGLFTSITGYLADSFRKPRSVKKNPVKTRRANQKVRFTCSKRCASC
jgi:voltage-gated potassium channel